MDEVELLLMMLGSIQRVLSSRILLHNGLLSELKLVEIVSEVSANKIVSVGVGPVAAPREIGRLHDVLPVDLVRRHVLSRDYMRRLCRDRRRLHHAGGARAAALEGADPVGRDRMSRSLRVEGLRDDVGLLPIGGPRSGRLGPTAIRAAHHRLDLGVL